MEPDRHSQCRDNRENALYHYRVAQNNIQTNLRIPHLALFEWDRSGHVQSSSESMPEDSLNPKEQIYQDRIWMAGYWQQLECSVTAHGYQLKVEDIGTFELAKDGREILCVEESVSAGFEQLKNTAVEAAMILALAIRGVWCLHASVVSLENRAIAFVGESGKGKSTLARWLGIQNNERWRQLGDDALPIYQAEESVVALPHFPQFKFPADAQPCLGMPERLPLDAVYVIKRPDRGSDRVGIRSLNSLDAAMQLVRHTMYTFLFDKKLLMSHLEFCAQMAARVPVRELIYPLTPDALVEVQDLVTIDLKNGIDTTQSLAR